MSRKARALGITFGCSTLLIVGGATMLSPSRELQFLDKYGHYDRQFDPYRPAGPLRGHRQGWRVFTDHVATETAIQDIQRHLPDWKMIRVKGGAEFTRDQEALSVRTGKSMYQALQLKGKTYAGRYVVNEGLAHEFHVDPNEVKGWMSIDHHWMDRAGLLDDYLGR